MARFEAHLRREKKSAVAYPAAKPQSRRRFRQIGIFETVCDRGSEAATIMRYVARHKYH
jgi:hypothetical protein